MLARYTHSSVQTDDALAVDIQSAGVTAKLARSAVTYVFLKDAVGSVIDVLDTAGNRLQHYVYSAFGELLGIQDAYANDISANPVLNTSYGFTGREHDSESGLMYYRARYYDPGTGRFLQQDPEPGKLRLPVSIVNRYIYVANNPLNLTDPTGRDFWGGLVLGLGAVAVGIATVMTGGLAAVALAAVAGGLANASISAFMNQPPSQVFNSFLNGAILAGAIAGGGFAIGALATGLGASAGLATGLGALYGAAVGGVAGYKAGGIGGAIVGAVLGGFSAGFSASAGAGAVTPGFTGIQAQMPVPNIVNPPIAPPEDWYPPMVAPSPVP